MNEKRNLQDYLRGTYARNWTGINEDAPSEKELAKGGLVPKVNNVWSLCEQGGEA